MIRSTDRILVTHAGSLPRPDDLRALLTAKASGQPYDQQAFSDRVASAVAEVVQLQLDSGIDSVNDGELSKSNFTNYARERLSGIESQPIPDGPRPAGINGRDMQEFAAYFTLRPMFGQGAPPTTRLVCTGPIQYTGGAEIAADIARFQAALAGKQVVEAFLPSVAPGTIEHWLHNAYYPNDEAFVYAIADAMHEEYKAITDAGFMLQIDDPDLPDAWQMYPEFDVASYRSFAQLRIEALNHALRDIPVEQIRFHVCWGSYHGPHKYDAPLSSIVDLVLDAKAAAYSIEAANPVHAHEWRVWETTKLPDGKALIPGVVGHASDFIEHPELVAERLVNFAGLVGRENVIAGTDCGLGGRVGHPSIVWAKFQAMAEGARLASERLWK